MMTTVSPAAVAAARPRGTVDLVAFCVFCGALVAPSRPGVFEHLTDACRDCWGTAQPCPAPENHGAGRVGVGGRWRCASPEPLGCAWCHRVVEADTGLCPDHREPCCGCCQPDGELG